VTDDEIQTIMKKRNCTIFGLAFAGTALQNQGILLTLLVCLGSACTATGDACSEPTFAVIRTLNAGTNPVFVAVGDFNGDGKSDLAVAKQGWYDSVSQTFTNSGISVLLGKGDGTFQTAVNYGTGTNPKFVVVGDFNGDGKPDLVVANEGSFGDFYTDSTIRLLLGKGDGTFQDAVKYGAAVGVASLAVGDFNGDGKLDLAAAYHGSERIGGGVLVLIGNGDGTIQKALKYDAGVFPVSIAVGDFTGDGKPDLAVGNVDNTSVLLGKGDGTFQAAVNFDLRSQALAVGDFNGDGKSDLVAVGTEFLPRALAGARKSTIGTVSVMLGKGDGALQTVVNHGAGLYPSSVAVGDLNDDGIPDLAVGDFNGDNLSVLLGNGDGTFRPIHVNPGAEAVALGDFNGDGKSDLVLVDSSANISILLNAGVATSPAPTFAQVGQFATGNDSRAVAVGDFNGDNKPDLAVANATGDVALLMGKGDGTFAVAVKHEVGAPISSVATGDFNGDGKLDLALAKFDSSSVSVLLGRGDGSFQSPVNYGAGTNPNFVAVGDLNGDGQADLAVATSKGVAVLIGKGDGAFQAAVNYGAGLSPGGVAVADFNGDGKLDLAVANFGDGEANIGNLSVLLGKGDGTFQAAANYGAGAGVRSVAVGDFNGDGTPDLAVADYGSYDPTSGTLTNHGVSVLLGRGDGTFRAAVTYEAEAGARSVAVGDLDGDGKADLVVVSFDEHAVLLGKGDGTFLKGINFRARLYPGSVALGDLNGDSKPDVVTIGDPNLFFDEATVWLNTSCSAGSSLAIARSGTTVTVSWPYPSAGYVLESGASLNPLSWKPADTSPANNNGRWEITMPTAQSQGYFRLLQTVNKYPCAAGKSPHSPGASRAVIMKTRTNQKTSKTA
jgi:hypothetical protein